MDLSFWGKGRESNENEISPIAEPQETSQQQEMLLNQLQEKQAECRELQQKVTEMENIIKQLRSTAPVQEAVESVAAEPAPAIPEEEEKKATPEIVPDAVNDLCQLVKNLQQAVSEQHAALQKENIEIRKELTEKSERYDKLVSSVQEDRYRKDKVKIMNRTINRRNIISSVLLEYQEDDMDGHDTPAAMFLARQLGEIVKGLDADLKQEMLTKVEKGVEGSNFDDEFQDIIDTVPTHNPDLAGKVCRTVNPGFVWTLPYIFKPRVNEDGEEIRSYKFLLRSEEVLVYKYVPEMTEENSTEN